MTTIGRSDINKYKFYITALFAFILINLISVERSYSQVDFTYGENSRGLRLSAGPNFTVLQTHFSQNPLITGFVGNLDYDINSYFSIGGEGQIGTLQGIDATHHLAYSSSTNDFTAANLNVKFAVGLIADFQCNNALDDAIKKIYVGVGFGAIKNDIVYYMYNDATKYEVHNHFTVIPFNLGTNIDLRGLLGNDRFAINPNYQFNIINSASADAVPPSSSSNSQSQGYYSAFSIKLKYKF